jgi:hypothetical protein
MQMKIRTPLLQIVCASLLALNSCSCANKAQSTSPSPNEANQGTIAALPQELLAKQPDFVAEEILFSAEERGGMGFVSGHQLLFKKAKQGEFYRRDTGLVVIYFDSENRSLRYDEKSKTVEEQKDGRQKADWYDGAENPLYFARKKGLTYTVVGKENVSGQECIKIKATKEGSISQGGDREEAVYFYVAKGMQNLVIATQIFLPNRRTSYVLKNISFKVPDDLFDNFSNRN